MIIDEGRKQYKETKRVLQRAMRESQLVLFAGAGVSADSGSPLWNAAIGQIADLLSMDKSDEDNLKIPQYYYNARGKKEYTQLMREIFCYQKHLVPNALHKKILDFHTQTIITTNYDHLIEQAAEENGEFVQVISKDADLPYRKSGRELIKMHGDFENDNFVLKEDDYLQYSMNFRLIETYIKSLIGSKAILFVGYSLNDQDVKQILAWVKEILQEDFQRAYLVVTGEEANGMKKAYLQNQGVNVIYASELVKGWEKKKHSEQLLEVLDFLLEEEKESELDRICNELRPLKELHYVYGKYLEKPLNPYGLQLTERCIKSLLVNRKSWLVKGLCMVLDGNKFLEEKKQDKYVEIREILKKSPIEQICVMQDGKWVKREISEVRLEDRGFEKLFLDFEYDKIENEISRLNRAVYHSDPEEYLKLAYFYAFIEKYLESYYCLKNAANIFYKKQMYVWYYITEFNRKSVGNIVAVNIHYRLEENECKAIEKEVKAIDLDGIYRSIPDTGNNHNQFLKELSNFNVIYQLLHSVYTDVEKIEAQAGETDKTQIQAYKNLVFHIWDYERYMIRNMIMSERYTECRSIYRLYISSKLREPLPLTKFDLYIMLRYIRRHELVNLFHEHMVKILSVEAEGIVYIEKVSGQICKSSFTELESVKDRIWKIVNLAAHVEMSAIMAQRILEYLIININEEMFRSYRADMNRFVTNICDQQLYRVEVICDLSKQVADKMLDWVTRQETIDIPEKAVISNLLYICHMGGKSYDDETYLSRMTEEKHLKLASFIMEFLSERGKTYICKTFEEWKPGESAEQYCRYCDAVLSDICQNDPETEQKMFSWLDQSLENRSEKSEVKSFSSDENAIDVIRDLTELYLKEKIHDVETYKRLTRKSGNQMSVWLSDMEHYDYEGFDLSWLEYCRERLLERIAQNQTARQNILREYQRQYEKKAVSQEVSEKVIKHFIIPPIV